MGTYYLTIFSIVKQKILWNEIFMVEKNEKAVDKDVQIRVRIPIFEKELIENAAQEHNVSFNKEIVSRLIQSRYELESYHNHIIPDELDYSLREEEIPYKAKIDILILINRIIIEVELKQIEIEKLNEMISSENDIILKTALHDVLPVKKYYTRFLSFCLGYALNLYKRYFHSEKLSDDDFNRIDAACALLKKLDATEASIKRIKDILEQIK